MRDVLIRAATKAIQERGSTSCVDAEVALDAILAALSEPTPEMIRAGWKAGKDFEGNEGSGDWFATVFRAMLSQASRPGKAEPGGR